MPDLKLRGKVAFVTGGGSGIGRAVCQLFAKEGASIYIMDVSEAGSKETMNSLTILHGNKHGSTKGDVSVLDDVINAFELCHRTLQNEPTILVNAAGVAKYSYAGQLSKGEIDHIIDINLKGTVFTCNEFLKRLPLSKEEVRGVIVNIASLSGKVGSAGLSVYSASKSGVVGFTRSIAAEFVMHKVRCNAVLPGFVDTPLSQNIDSFSVQRAVRRTPYGRPGDVSEIAKACLYLASDDSSFVCGACLNVSGCGDTPYALRAKL